eukprot:5244837-Amphidinium_carterae.1
MGGARTCAGFFRRNDSNKLHPKVVPKAPLCALGRGYLTTRGHRTWSVPQVVPRNTAERMMAIVVRILCHNDCTRLTQGLTYVGFLGSGTFGTSSCNPSGRYWQRMCWASTGLENKSSTSSLRGFFSSWANCIGDMEVPNIFVRCPFSVFGGLRKHLRIGMHYHLAYIMPASQLLARQQTSTIKCAEITGLWRRVGAGH